MKPIPTASVAVHDASWFAGIHSRRPGPTTPYRTYGLARRHPSAGGTLRHPNPALTRNKSGIRNVIGIYDKVDMTGKKRIPRWTLEGSERATLRSMEEHKSGPVNGVVIERSKFAVFGCGPNGPGKILGRERESNSRCGDTVAIRIQAIQVSKICFGTTKWKTYANGAWLRGWERKSSMAVDLRK
ncbi:hypothetical protein M413DRAFT_13468 [Hebeloma cylindrosporum]|uniref:Uncharacterized protein n=1 Tax=Hebeloma cylindrosporum TaxID=76867 RepID=A0A0C3C0X0_HEBCY|nr:hypothetical protein M413DRAFT_13468 [Hebeloma cylindrosporum h7]